MISSNHTDRLPVDPGVLAAWFAEGVRAELAALEKEGGTRDYEVLSGQLIETIGPTQAIFQFIIADGTWVPEDTTGRLKIEDDEYLASVICQQADRIYLRIEGRTPLSSSIPRATLIIDDTALLRRLAEVLDETTTNPTRVGPLATLVFHPTKVKVGFANLSDVPLLRDVGPEQRRVIEQASGSSITYIWGPPGTGKTFVIARLVATFVESGERVLVTSHTNAAVDQALYETVKGPLAGHPAVRDGKILRLGFTVDQKIPDSVRLDKVIELQALQLENQILELESKTSPFIEKRTWCYTAISEWDKLQELTDHLQAARRKIEQAEMERSHVERTVLRRKRLLLRRQAQLERAQHAWFRRSARVERATRTLRDAEDELRKAEDALKLIVHKVKKMQQLVNEIEAALINQQAICENLPAKETLERELSLIALKLNPLEEKIRTLQEEVSQLEQELISNAQVIFCTLTKNYTGRELEGQKFDVVIVDEISIAPPPLIFLAAGRATSRVILVGDFLQLPPIVRSDAKISKVRLGKDIFHLAGLVHGLKPVDNCPVLTKLSRQRRMTPTIADIARDLVYHLAGLDLRDDEEVCKKGSPEWLDFLPANPLIIVDTADLHCWSGKQPGSLSRFNFYSATVAVKLAAMAAANLHRPSKPPSIGIVTPFVAQRRLISKLVRDMELNDWVTVGTVHTFQGGEAELIIFDSVLDEPYWSARLCNPKLREETIRELNVAITRAKSKFMFVGSSEWLNKHAKPPSALGELWELLKDRADLIPALDIVGSNFLRQTLFHHTETAGWNPSGEKSYKFEYLDETSFFRRFAEDLSAATSSIFGLAPYFGEYRWPKIQPLFSAALARGVEVTLVTPPLSEAQNPWYVEKVIKNLRDLGAVVVQASGLHGKDVIIDEKIVYTGSMNWSSHRGRAEVIHRIESPEYAKLCLELMQAKYIRKAAIYEDGTLRVCPYCGYPIQIVNQRHQRGHWDFQPMKVGCSNPRCQRYLRDIDERPPFVEIPRCQIDGRTKYRRIRQRKREIWQCPKHPKECPTFKVVPGDPE